MPRFVLPRAAKRAVLATAGLALAFTAVMGFAHTKPGRPLLVWMKIKGAAPGGCPLGYNVAQTPAQREAARRRFASSHAGEFRALLRPALGFSLDETTRDDVQTWANEHGVSCKKPRSGPDLDCSDVPSRALPEPYRGVPIGSLWMTFGDKGTLTSVIAVRRDASAEAISATFVALTAEVDKEAGAKRSSEGNPSAAALSSAPLKQASAEYRFRDYYALARATNMGQGFALTEEYRSLPE
ncbi:MAG: hypothetical protein V9G22_15735 [Ottowia sp.]